MTKDEVLKLALEALEDLGMKHYESTGEVLYKETFTAIKEALAQRTFDYKEHAEGLQRDYDLLLAEYNDLKAQRTWVGLTDKELNLIGAQWHYNLLDKDDKAELFAFARAIEAAHGIGEKNG